MLAAVRSDMMGLRLANVSFMTSFQRFGIFVLVVYLEWTICKDRRLYNVSNMCVWYDRVGVRMRNRNQSHVNKLANLIVPNFEHRL